MKFKRIILFPVLLSLFSCLSQPKPYELTEAISIDNPYGFSYKAKELDQQRYDIMTELGSSWIRADFFWDQLESEPAEWDFTLYDSFVETCRRNEQKIICLLVYDTPWIRKFETDRKRYFYIAPDKIPDYLNYVRTVVDRYDDDIAVYEIWNEPNGFFWLGTDEEFFELQRQTAAAIKEINPDAIVSCAGLFLGDTPYIQKMYRAGALENIDVLAVHPYAVNSERANRQMDKVIHLGNQLGFQGEYWITEMGFPTSGSSPNAIPADEFSSEILKTHCYLLSQKIPVIIWYTIFDSGPESKYPYGLVVEPDYTWKEGAYAYRLLGNHVRSAQLRNDLLQPTDSIEQKTLAYHFINDKGEGVLVIWARNQESEITIRFPSEEVTEHDIRSIDNWETESELTITVTDEPRFFTYRSDEELPVEIR